MHERQEEEEGVAARWHRVEAVWQITNAFNVVLEGELVAHHAADVGEWQS